MNRGRTGERPWSDLYPDLLNSIYAKLPSHVERAGFGSVCKNWRRIYSATADYAAPRATHNADFTVCTFRSGSTVTSMPQQLPDRLRRDFDGASVVGRGSGWWLLSNSAGEIFCCFNPLLQSPRNVIELPRMLLSLRYFGGGNPRKAAFSAPPTDPGSTIFVLHDGCRTFSTLLRRENRWETFRIPGGERICAGIGYSEGQFLCLFETGDVFVFGIEGRRGRMMRTARPLAPERFRRTNYLRAILVAEEGEREFEVANWERVLNPVGSFRLLAVERETTMLPPPAAADGDDETASLEEGASFGRVVLVPEQHRTVRWETPMDAAGFCRVNCFFTFFVLILLCLLLVTIFCPALLRGYGEFGFQFLEQINVFGA